jgi:uncharacterized membrane protein
MTNLVLASLFLLLSHFLIASTPLRDLLARRLGERPYTVCYSLLAFVAFAWLILAYRGAPAVPLWDAPRWLDLALVPVMLLASILAVAGISTPNPGMVQSERLFDHPDIVRGVLRISRNSLFWGVGLFALCHVIVIGDMTATLAFGSVALLGLAGAAVLDAKKARRHGAAWQSFAAATSSIPFLAIVQGRQRLAPGEIGWWRIALGVALFLVTLVFHRTLFGRDVIAIFSGLR